MFVTPQFCYDEEQYFVGFSFSVIFTKNPNFKLKYLLGILNSSMAQYWFNRFGKHRGVGVDIGVKTFRQFPVFDASTKQQNQVIKFVDKLTTLYQQKHDTEKIFWNRVIHKFKITSNLMDFQFSNMQFNQFLSYIENISDIQLNLDEQNKWETFFNSTSNSIQKISKNIYETESQLDVYIFDLYGFSRNEISLIQKI